MQIFAFVYHKILAWRRRKALFALAHAALFLPVAGGAAEICRRSADIMDISLEIGHSGKHFCLTDNGILAAAGNISSLMISYGAEIAGAEATAHMSYRKFHLFYRGNSSLRFI